MRFAIVIMAAGRGTRLKSKRPKVLHQAGGKALISHVIEAAQNLVLPQDIYVVVGHHAGDVKAALAGWEGNFVDQPDQRGTGHAIQQTGEAVKGYDNIIVLSGDAPLIQPETIARLRDFHLSHKASMTILTAAPENPFGYGRLIRDAKNPAYVRAIVEQRELTPEQAEVREINSGAYAFIRERLYEHIGQLDTKNAHGEFYLTDMARIFTEASERVVAVEAVNNDDVLGANTIEEMMQVDAKLRLRSARRLMDKGVTIFRPETTVIDSNVIVGADSVIEPFVQLLGETVIGENCRIRSFSVLEDAKLGNKVLIRNGCIITGSQIHDNASIGPYAHLRLESEIGESAHVGNFVETKKATLGIGSKANHLTYLGDAEIGAGVNIGAGVITCNYDGVNKTKTTIGDRAFVGSDSTLVAPVNLGAGSYVAAGSCITEDVPEDALALSRTRQTVKEGWARKRPTTIQKKG